MRTLIRRARKPRKAYTDAQGYKTADAPADWPFGTIRPSTAKPRVIRPVVRRVEARADAPTRPDKIDLSDIEDAPF